MDSTTFTRMKRAKVLASSPTFLPLKFDHNSVLDRSIFSENAVRVNGVQKNVPFFCNTTLTVTVDSVQSTEGDYTIYYDISWVPIQGAAAYKITLSTIDSYKVEYTSTTTARVYVKWNSETSPETYQMTIKADDICLTTVITTLYVAL